jgi:hypothetical protein
MMRELETEMKKFGIPFDRDGNRVRYAACSHILNILFEFIFSRCFPNVIDIAVKAGLKQITSLPDDSAEATAYDDMFYQDVPVGLSDLDVEETSAGVLPLDCEY